MLSRNVPVQEACRNLDFFVEVYDIEASGRKSTGRRAEVEGGDFVNDPVNQLIETVLVHKKIKRQLHLQ